MSFRMRMVLASLVVGVFAILAASFGAYFASRNALINSADDVLQSAAADVTGAAGSQHFPVVPETGAISGIPGVSNAQLYISQPLSQPRLPVTAAVKAVAAGTAHPFFTDVRADGYEQREYVTYVTVSASTDGVFAQSESGALQVSNSLTGVDEQLSHLGLALLLVALAALALAAVSYTHLDVYKRQGRSTNAGLLDEAPAPAGLGEDGVGVVVHSGGESRRRLMVGMGRKVDEVLEDLVTETR